MSEERKNQGRLGGGDEVRGGGASRARNRTVLLSPETIGQVRAGLADEEDTSAAGGVPDPLNELLPPMGGWEGAKEPVREPEPAVDPGDSFPPFNRQAESGAADAGTRRPVGRFTPQPVTNAQGGWGTGLQASTPQPVSPVRAKPPTGGAVRPMTPQAPEPIPARAVAHAAPVRQTPRSRVVGFLISYDTDQHGEVHEVRAGRWLVTSRPTDHQDYVLIDDESVSPLHAIIRATAEGKVQVLDQLSEFGTGVTRHDSDEEEEVAGSMASVGHGDSIRFGKRKFVVCLIPQKG